MIISHKHKFICIDPPKTGTNYRQSLLWNYGEHISELQHANLIEVKNFFQGRNLEDYFVFAFVRNPWRRYLSWFNFFYRDSSEEKLSPEEFHKFMHLYLSQNFQESKARISLPQSFWFKHNDQINVDFIGSLENITQDMESILDKIKINIQPKSKATNQSKYKLNFCDAYNQQLIDLVAQKEKVVISLMDYKYE